MPRILLTIICSAILSSHAIAQEQQSIENTPEYQKLAKEITKRAIKRARRGIAVGPYAAIAPGLTFDGDIDFQASAGLALYKFDIPVTPSQKRILEIVKARMKDAMKQRVKKMIQQNKKPSKADMRKIADQVWADIKKELLMVLQPKTFEKPSFAIRAEAGYSTASDAWEIRATGSIGIGPLFLSPGVALVFADSPAVYFPAEISVPIVLGKSVRTPVLDIFLRADFAANNRDENKDRAMLGARLLYDIL